MDLCARISFLWFLLTAEFRAVLRKKIPSRQNRTKIQTKANKCAWSVSTLSLRHNKSIRERFREKRERGAHL